MELMILTIGKVIPNFIEQVIQGDKVKPVDGQSIKIIGYEYAYAVSDSGTVQPDDNLFSTAVLPVQGKWLWTRVTTRYNDGKETKAYYPSYQGQDAKAFRIIADNTVVVRNDRRSDTQTITFRAEISGYPDANPLWYINGQKVGEGGTYSRSVAYKEAEAFSINLYNGTILMDTLNLTVIDKTGGNVFLGECDNEVPVKTPSGEALINYDYFLCTGNFDIYEEGNPYIYLNGTFVYPEKNEIVDETKWAEIMNGCLNSAVDSNDPIEGTAFHKWFKSLATKYGFARFLAVYRLLMGTGNKTNGFYFLIADVDENGNKLSIPVFQCLYNGKNLFSIDPLTPQVIIGDYHNKGGILWDGLNQELLINGSGRFSGLLDTITIYTQIGSQNFQALGTVNTNDELFSKFIEYKLNTEYVASGNYKNKQIAKLFISNINYQTVSDKVVFKGWSGGTYFGGHDTTYGTGIAWINLTIYFTDDTNETFTVRKILQYWDMDGENADGSFHNAIYPIPISIPDNSTIDSILQMKNWQSVLYPYSTVINMSGSMYDKLRTESAYNNIGSLRHELDSSISDLVIFDSTDEELYIRNLPNIKPTSKPNAIWRDSEGYLRIV